MLAILVSSDADLAKASVPGEMLCCILEQFVSWAFQVWVPAQHISEPQGAGLRINAMRPVDAAYPYVQGPSSKFYKVLCSRILPHERRGGNQNEEQPGGASRTYLKRAILRIGVRQYRRG